MHLRAILILMPLLAFLQGCSLLQGGKLYAPETFGLVPIAPNLYVEPGTDAATQERLRAAVDRAAAAITAAYGSARAHPKINACVTETCFESFGGRGAFAKAYGTRLLISPRALNWHFIAHEWSHAELVTRLSLPAWKNMPQWFDEGVAVCISEAPEHSEAHWQSIVAADLARPTREELHTLVKLSQWLDAASRYGVAVGNPDRYARGEPLVHSLYAAAGHELRPWLAREGSAGLLAFIDRMNAGERFESVYAAGATP